MYRSSEDNAIVKDSLGSCCGWYLRADGRDTAKQSGKGHAKPAAHLEIVAEKQ